MSASAILFYCMSAMVLISGFLAVSSLKIFRAAIWLLFSLIGIAGLFLWMDQEFLAAVQIVVYVGGIVVLIIFSIFLTQQSGRDMPKPVRSRAVFAALAAIFGFGFTFRLIQLYGFRITPGSTVSVSVGSIGTQLLSSGKGGYALPFETVSLLLLAAMVGCIVIAMKSKSNS